MRRWLLGAALVALTLWSLVSVRPALAHDGIGPAGVGAPQPSRQTRDARAEASQLTDELRAAAARPAKVPAVQAAVASQAERRRDLLRLLADSNPAAVLELALTPSERAALPPGLRPLVEEQFDGDGELVVLHIDYEDGHSAYDSKLISGAQERPIKFGAPLGKAKPGDTVRLNGVALAGEATVVSDQMVVIQSPTAVGTTGNQRTAVILVTAPGVASHPYANKANTASIFFATANAQSARSFYREVSYSQTTIVGGQGTEGTAGDVYGPYGIAHANCDTTTIRTQALAAADPEVNFNAYDRVVLSFANPTCGNGGVGTIRTQNVGAFDGASQRLSVSWDFNGALGSTALNGKVGGVALHEYGHNLGVWHANALECGADAIAGDSCASDEYGDHADVMGSSGGYGHMNGVHKDILGWVSARTRTATAAGSYVIQAYENQSFDPNGDQAALIANTRVLKVPRTRDASGNVNGYYYLEYRKPAVPWDAFATSWTDYGSGILVHTAGATPFCTSVCSPDWTGAGGGGDSNIIDTQPSSIAGFTDFRDAPLGVGETYSDSGAGVTLTVTSAGPTSATVAVAFSTPLRSIRTTVYPAGAGTVSGGGSFQVGQQTTLAATPAGCFLYWRENRATQGYPNPYAITVSADRQLEAVFADTSCAPPPSNDAFPGPTVTGGQFAATNTSATLETGEPTSFSCAGSATTVGRTFWYSITPTAASAITVSSLGSDFDTVVAVYTGSAVGALTQVACNDDAASTLQSTVQFAAQAGTTYRVQVGGYNGAAGNATVNISSATQSSDPRQEGPLVVGGNLTVGGMATFAVTIKNYGPVQTPAIYPLVDGTNPSGQAWRASSPQPASAVIQPGQSATFTVQVPVAQAGAWTTTGVVVWNNDTNALLKALPANGQNQQVGFQVAMACSPRPPVTLTSATHGDGRLTVTVAVTEKDAGNRLVRLKFGQDSHVATVNALIDLPGVGDGRSSPSTVELPNRPTSYTFYVRRATPGTPVTVPVTVTDLCGDWQTMVGGGVRAGF